MIYMIKYPHRLWITTQDNFEREIKACYSLGINYVVNNYKNVSKELIIGL